MNRGIVVAVAVVLAGCVSLTPAQQKGADESRAFLKAAAAAYKVWTPGLVVGPTNTEGGRYQQGTIFVNSTMLASPNREALLAHEFGHYLLGHEPRRIYNQLDWQREGELREQAANVKAVEILMRVKQISEAEAVRIMRRKFEAIIRYYERGGAGAWVPGHKTPHEELADFLAAFPQHRLASD